MFRSSHEPTFITWSMDLVTLGSSLSKSARCLRWWPWLLWKWRYNIFDLSRHLRRPPHWGVIQIYQWKLFAICHHPYKFGNHRHCDSGEMLLIYHVNACLYGYVNLLKDVPYSKSPLVMFGVHWLSASRDIKYLICHVTEGSRAL